MVLPTQCHFVEGDYPEASAQDVSKLEPLENGGNYIGMYCVVVVCCFDNLCFNPFHSLEVFIKL